MSAALRLQRAIDDLHQFHFAQYPRPDRSGRLYCRLISRADYFARFFALYPRDEEFRGQLTARLGSDTDGPLPDFLVDAFTWNEGC